MYVCMYVWTLFPAKLVTIDESQIWGGKLWSRRNWSSWKLTIWQLQNLAVEYLAEVFEVLILIIRFFVQLGCDSVVEKIPEAFCISNAGANPRFG